MQNGYRKANRKKVREGNTLDVREADARIISARIVKTVLQCD